MCRTQTPKANQISCARCKTGVVNPDDGWEYRMLTGVIKLRMHSRISDYAISGRGYVPEKDNENTALKSTAVRELYPQGMHLEFGLYPSFVETGSFGEPDGRYPLCESCHKILLRVIGEFFFARPRMLDAFVRELNETWPTRR